MAPWKAARVGDHIDQIDTPALVLDLDAFERNMKRLQDAVSSAGVRLRPHAKSHKCPEIALRQIQMGAVGICCQKVSEAAVFVDAGISDILITNQVVGEKKIAHTLDLAARVRIGVLVDHEDQISAFVRASAERQVLIDVYLEIDVGMGRCGVASIERAVAMAQQIDAAPFLNFMGLQCYHGSAQHYRLPEERQQAIAAVCAKAAAAKAAIEGVGIRVERISGAGTGSVMLESHSKLFNEVQAGSYILMDRDYATNQRDPGDLPFEHALFVKTAVLSHPSNNRAVVDAGLKASSVDSGMPVVWQRSDAKYLKASDEHGVLELTPDSTLKLGDYLLLVPGHCDPTVNLYDELIAIRGDRVEAIWPVAARGALL
ncbi:DSD1 family PLP-dependent enzyme [Polynucleobacter sp. HIN6]|uniref:DSD1 family PLP-dependent enzyme n=1 Tax=Polynucleobacter sp. HIN6 TaxID=3047865 RepID=UPI0025726479|nr:DSD1 family PLP-dependent enzyme [Polynucleobacter sp. HIN6]BEI35606.1 DSD1 family PLP-dependent enzyme [Polynucleobacter sp. HIN6]